MSKAVVMLTTGGTMPSLNPRTVGFVAGYMLSCGALALALAQARLDGHFPVRRRRPTGVSDHSRSRIDQSGRLSVTISHCYRRIRPMSDDRRLARRL